MASAVMSLVATSSSRIRELTIKDGQLIFIQDLGRIAFDYKGQRVFYNQIVELETEAERLDLNEPLDGYYFVIDSACLWFYKDGWTQITEKPDNILFIDVELPQLGQAKEGTLYVNKQNRFRFFSNLSPTIFVKPQTSSINNKIITVQRLF